METITIIILSVSLLCSIASIVLSYSANDKSKVANEQFKVANGQSHLNSQGMIELAIADKIDITEGRISNLSITMAPLFAKSECSELSKEEEVILGIYRTTLIATEQSMLNSYDIACSKYIDGKVDKIRFKKDFQGRIRNLMSDKSLSDYFNNHTSTYQPIIKVYHEWDDTER